MMLRNRLAAAAAVAAFLVASSIPAVAGGWSHGYEADYDSYYDAPAYGYRSYGIAAVPVVTFVPVPFVSHQRVLIVNQGPTYVPTSVGYIWPTVEYAPQRTFPYGSSGYGRQVYYGHRHHHHRHHPRHHVRSYRGHHPMPGYK